jgi:hypothetical protein
MAMAVVRREMRPRAEEGRPGDAPTSSLRVTDARPGLGRFMRPRTGDPGRCGKPHEHQSRPARGPEPVGSRRGALWPAATDGQRPFPGRPGRRA